jgi:small subunit ribosomal protein S18
MRKKTCYFTENGFKYIDYKNARMLRRFTDRFGRIKKRYYTGVSLKFQKQLATAIKRARFMALVPFVK